MKRSLSARLVTFLNSGVSFSKVTSARKPEKSEETEKLSNRNFQVSVFMSHCLKRGNQNLSSESLRGIVRSNKLSEVKSLSKPKSLFMSKSGQFLKDFSYKNFVFLFFTLTHNDRGYGLGRAAGEFPVVKRQGKCGRKDCQKHISRPKRIGVCYGL